jgi:F0F1-type ATP synthase membrane subunit c/vacuolar-type H+-ATPase subunit K
MGLVLGFALVGAGIPMGLIFAGMGFHDRVAADRPTRVRG